MGSLGLHVSLNITSHRVIQIDNILCLWPLTFYTYYGITYTTLFIVIITYCFYTFLIDL